MFNWENRVGFFCFLDWINVLYENEAFLILQILTKSIYNLLKSKQNHFESRKPICASIFFKLRNLRQYIIENEKQNYWNAGNRSSFWVCSYEENSWPSYFLQPSFCHLVLPSFSWTMIVWHLITDCRIEPLWSLLFSRFHTMVRVGENLLIYL